MKDDSANDLSHNALRQMRFNRSEAIGGRADRLISSSTGGREV